MNRDPWAISNKFSDTDLLKRATTLMVRGDYALAIDRFRELIELKTHDESALEIRLSSELALIRCHAILGQYEDVEIRLPSVKRLASDQPLALAAIRSLEGWTAYLRGKTEDAFENLNSSLSMLREIGTEEWIPDTARWLGYAYRSKGLIQDAIRCMYESIGAAERRGEVASAARTRSGLARLYRNLGHFEVARDLFERAYADFWELGSSAMAQRIAVDLSVLSRLAGQLALGRDYAIKAIAIAEENQAQLSTLLGKLALARIEFQLGNTDQTRDLVSTVLGVASKNHYFHPHVLALEDRGDLAFSQGSFQEALADYLAAFDLLETKERGEFPGELAWRIGLSYLNLQNVEQAAIWITRGLDICEKTGDTKELAVTIRAHGVLLLHQGDIEGGLQRIRESLDRLRRLAVPFEVARCHLELAKAAHQFTKSRKDFELEIESAHDLFTQIGAGLGLRWTSELRQNLVWEENSRTAPRSSDLITESDLQVDFSSADASFKNVRFAQSTLGIVWRSPKYLEALDILRHFALSKAPLLLTGETGAGKTAFAEIAHVLGSNPREPFVVVNCASLPESLLESELFGHVRGAFTGAERDKPGLIRSAGAGTIFLDEVDKASASFQANLLHVLDRREIRAVGSHTFHEVRARFVLATNRDLSALAAQGDFLADLEYRISGLRVDVPPLRDRIDDFDLLLALALRELRMAENITKGITIEARNFLSSYHWPGNLRELFSVITAAGLLTDEDASISMQGIQRVFRDSRRATHVERASRSGTLASRMDELEKEELMMTLRLEGGSQSRAAEKLGITRRGLNKKLHRLGLIDQLDREGLAGFTTRKKDGPEEASSTDDLDS